jgi:hypothetical protein
VTGPYTVYAIRNRITGWLYIGSTRKSAGERWAQHRYSLRRGLHRCARFQEDFDRFGEESFAVLVLEEGVALGVEAWYLAEYRGDLYNRFRLSHTFSLPRTPPVSMTKLDKLHELWEATRSAEGRK